MLVRSRVLNKQDEGLFRKSSSFVDKLEPPEQNCPRKPKVHRFENIKSNKRDATHRLLKSPRVEYHTPNC